MLVVGLTGGIASGKSTVSALLKASQISLIDLDLLSRLAVSPSSPALALLVEHFGDTILLPSGELDRAALGRVVFGNEKERKVLNSIVHPEVRRRLRWELLRCWWRGERMCIVDAPLLVEAGLWKWCGAIIVVYCSESLQLQRLLSRNALTPTEARDRIKSQAPLSTKLVYADFVIDNSGPLSELGPQVDRVIAKLRVRTWGWWLSWLCPPWGVLSAIMVVGYRLGIKGVGKERRARHKTRGERGERRDEVELSELRRARS